MSAVDREWDLSLSAERAGQPLSLETTDSTQSLSPALELQLSLCLNVAGEDQRWSARKMMGVAIFANAVMWCLLFAGTSALVAALK